MTNLLTYKILIVDDEEADYVLAKEHLSRVTVCKYETFWARDHSEAETKILSSPSDYDAIIIDFYLGAQSGLELLKNLRKHHILIPIIFLTASNDPKIDLDAMNSGAADYLTKETLNAHLLDRSIRYAIEQKKNEKLILRQQRELGALLKLAALGELASMITHEINNPLSVIQARTYGTLRALDNELFDKKRIQQNAKSVLTMIERILRIKENLKRYYGNFSESLYEETRLEELVKEAIELCQDKINAHGIKVEVSPESNKISFECQPTEISQVLVNLITNSCDAIKDISEKWVRIDAEQKGEDITIKVTDSGKNPGIEVQKKIFSKFFTTKNSGMGLGLNLSKRIIESHNGTLNLNLNSKNTQFVICIPKTRMTIKEKKYRFLIIDDESEILEIVRDEILLHGHEAETDTNPISAKEKILKGTFDAVVCDVHLPKLNGIDLAKSISAQVEKPPVFIFISGFVSPAIKKVIETTEIGLKDKVHFFEKPFNIKELVEHAIASIEHE